MSSATETPQKYVLGLDLGSASLGWAMIALNPADQPTTLVRAGVRIFEPGVDGTALDIEQGKDQSKAVERRTARLHRRQLRRRAARQRELFQELQKAGLIPTNALGTGASSEQRHELLNELDRSLTLKFLKPNDDSFAQKPLYLLRKLALDQALQPFELGRVLFHLSQRRGFKSNRKETKKTAKENEDLGQVKADIHALELAIQEAGARTIGEYFAGLDPHTEKVRRRWTARKMFEQEFALIWDAQVKHHASLLTQELHDRVHELLFFQRPISAQKHLVGTCELERGDDKHPPKRRAPWATMAAQRFRMLQKINDLAVIDTKQQTSRKLTEDERAKLYQLLDREGTQSFTAIRKYLDLKGTIFNLEAGGDKDLPGNRTQKSMRKVFGVFWDEFTEGKQNQIIENWRNSESDEALIQEAIDHLGLDAEAAAVLAKESPQTDYCSLSLAAITKLMPLMLAGRAFKDAETEVYGSRFSGLTVHDTLPPVRDALPTLRNPAVERAMTELRKVVNAIIREYGKPYEIRIELARELKKPRQERIKATTANRKREADNKGIAAKILSECGIANPSRADLEKAKLFVECGGICPYTGRSIPFSQLFQDSEFDVEHIIPRSRFPDDSFQNKTLCYLPENREYKRNQTPFEAYSNNPEVWAQILSRVAKWSNPGKLSRFKIQSERELADFSARQMNDTRYTSVLAGRLLAMLYGGRDVETDNGNRQVIFASSGAVTATLRRSWGFERILQSIVSPEPGEARGKPRTDHRHHAVDAITIALTRQSVIQAMANASALEPWQAGTRSWRRVPEPWTTPDFVGNLTELVAKMVVSHRPEHKISGELHKGSNFSRPYLHNGKSTVHTRCALCELKPADIAADDIVVDKAILAIIRARLSEVGGNLKAFEDPNNLPFLTTGNGRKIPIKKVRIRQVKEPKVAAKGDRERFVDSGGIHHVALFVARNEARQEQWLSEVVQVTEVYQRCPRRDKRSGRPRAIASEPAVSRKLKGNPEAEFLFSLMKDDTVELDSNGGRAVFRVKKFYAAGPIWFTGVNNAQMDADQKKHKTTWSKNPNGLKTLNPRKVVVDLLGRVHTAND
jgi:CRISPR-associated endonuclease Csn1